MTHQAQTSKPGDVHVTPVQGKPHEESSKCWCLPRLDMTDPHTKVSVWVHNLAN